VVEGGLRHRIRVALLAAAFVALFWQCMHSEGLVARERGDYTAYWMAARLLLTGGNPYDLRQVAALQGVPAAPGGTVLIAWNPPWVLALFLPFAFRDYSLSRTLWLLANGTALLAGIGMLWRRYGDTPERRWVAVALGVLFPPTLLAIWMGQITPLVFAGVAGFLHLGARGRWGWAGACLGLAAAKPHLLGPLWVVLGLWVWRERRWPLVAGAALAVAAATLIAVCLDPLVVGRYREMMASGPAMPDLLMTATTGALLRVFLGKERLWLQYAPAVVAACWAGAYYLRHRTAWNWTEHTPVLLIASVVGAPYAWPPDYVLLVPAILQAAGGVRGGPGTRLALGVYLAVAAAGYAVWFSQVAGVRHAWLPWAVLAGHTVFRRGARTALPEGATASTPGRTEAPQPPPGHEAGVEQASPSRRRGG